MITARWLITRKEGSKFVLVGSELVLLVIVDLSQPLLREDEWAGGGGLWRHEF
jgi:hypothetical protein